MAVSNIFYFHPYFGEMIQFETNSSYFSNGLVQPPTRTAMPRWISAPTPFSTRGPRPSRSVPWPRRRRRRRRRCRWRRRGSQEFRAFCSETTQTRGSVGFYMAVSLNGGFSPQIIHFNRVFHDKPHHPFLGYTPIFGNTHMLYKESDSFRNF